MPTARRSMPICECSARGPTEDGHARRAAPPVRRMGRRRGLLRRGLGRRGQARDRERAAVPVPCRSWSAGRACISAPCWTGSRRCPQSIAAVRAAGARTARRRSLCRRCRPRIPKRAATLNPGDTQRASPARWKWCARPAGRCANGSDSATAGSAMRLTLHPLVLLPDRAMALRTLRPPLRDDDGQWRGRRSRGAARARPRPRPAGDARYRRAARLPDYLRGEWSREEAIARGQQATRNYAKRQYTWFRHQPPEDWPRLIT